MTCSICNRPIYESEQQHGHTWCAACRHARHTDRKLKALYAITVAIPDEQARLNAEVRFMRSLLIDRLGFSEADYWEACVAFLQARGEHVG